jgi:hypothetical protein
MLVTQSLHAHDEHPACLRLSESKRSIAPHAGQVNGNRHGKPLKMFTRDGYINEQSLTADIPYGRLSSDENGCGWIAAFNVLRRIEAQTPCPEFVAQSLLNGLVLCGYLGTSPIAIIRFLRRRGHEVRWALRRDEQKQLAADSAASIFLYVGPFLRWHQFQLHYVMLYPEGARGMRILNFARDPYWESLESLESRLCASTFTLLIGVNPKS